VALVTNTRLEQKSMTVTITLVHCTQKLVTAVKCLMNLLVQLIYFFPIVMMKPYAAALVTNNRLGQKWWTVTNTLFLFTEALVRAVTCIMNLFGLSNINILQL
jgi:hypothetical protein